MYTAPDTATTRAEHAYGELKQRLLAGDFALGGRLAEERLASLMGVSRTPVREALSRLHTEGFVARLPDGGFCPTAPNLQSMRELYEVRRGLELLALHLPASHDAASHGAAPHTRGSDDPARHDHDRLESLRADWQSLEVPDGALGPDPSFVLLDEDFHVRLAEAAGNHELVVLLQGINERIRLVRIYDFLTPERIAATVTQHLGIVDSVLAGDVTRADAELNAHLSESLAVVEQRASAALARMISERMPT